jgi:hypothetical protein
MSRSGWLERDLIGDTSAHECATRLWLASAVRSAVRDPRPGVLSLLAVVGACLAGLPALVLAVPATYGLRWLLALLDRRARQAALREARERPIDLPSPVYFSDGDARRLIERIGNSRWAIQKAVFSGPQGPGFAVAGLAEEIPQVERDVVVLASRVEYLGRFLRCAPSAELHTEVVRLDKDREMEPEGATRDGLQRLIDRCREHLDALTALAIRRSHSLQAAEDLLHTLEQIPARIVSLQLARVESSDVRAGDARPRAAAIVDSFETLQREMEGTISAPG